MQSKGPHLEGLK